MQKTSYQTPELRDENDSIIQEGSFGKNTALSNATNDGWIDYVMNNLEALHDTIGDSAPTLDGNGHVVEPANLSIGDEDGVRLKTGYIKTSGGTMTGTLNIAQNLKMQDNQENVFGGLYVPGTTATLQYLQLYGGETPSSNGGNLQLPNDGSWTLQAKNGATAYNLVGGTDGTLKWRGNELAWKKDFLPLSGGSITGTLTAPTPSTTDDSTKVATTEFVKNASMYFLGTNPVDSVENDSREFWVSKGSCFAFFNQKRLNGQPNVVGFLVSYVQNAEVYQMWMAQEQTHDVYKRRANVTINDMPIFKLINDEYSAYSHNDHYRGQYLGSTVTDEQWAEIKAGTFGNEHLGDYWTIYNENWRIAAFNYFYGTGDVVCNKNHLVIVPDKAIATCNMNSTDITTGGYVGSDFRTGNNGNIGLSTAINKIYSAFGEEHILSHRELLTNAVSGGAPSGQSWYDCKVELMNQTMLTGQENNGLIGPTNQDGNVGIARGQFPLFAFRPLLAGYRTSFWLRSVVSESAFSSAISDGSVTVSNSTRNLGVFPYFLIYQS